VRDIKLLFHRNHIAIARESRGRLNVYNWLSRIVS